MRLKSKITNQQGFTLIELILYIAIIVMFLTTLIPFAWNVIEGGAKSATQQEIYSQARFISERVKYEIRNASGINSISATSINLATSTAGTNPTIISLSGTNLTIKEGTGTTTNLNSSDTGVSSMTFTNLTSANTYTKNIQFSFTVSDVLISSRNEFTESVDIQSSAEVRSN
ncbi:MAG: prepilin-type N-terminal cleavage/methylation domain-containing protein [bacterium]|nr:prepilin-type N-terminal cleavage/methylation domain-containing protein [bacterium]